MNSYHALLCFVALCFGQRVVETNIWRADTDTPTKRQIGVEISQNVQRSLYMVDINLGSPGQKQTLQIDTGGQSLWVPATGSKICRSSFVSCASLGSFNSSLSSTFEGTERDAKISYADGSGVSGRFFFDSVQIGGKTVVEQIGVLATEGTSITQGVLGLGFPATFSTINHNLAAQKLTASNSYSLYLNSLISGQGSILFGGIDTTKFFAPLHKLAITPTIQADGTMSFDGAVVQLTSVTVKDASEGKSGTIIEAPIAVNLDSGTTLTILPASVIAAMLAPLNGMFYPLNSTSGPTVAPCNEATSNTSISYTFGQDARIIVPIKELILSPVGSLNGVSYCRLGLYGSKGDLPNLLGDTFLRSAYVVYHLDKGEIGLAQARFEQAGEGKIVEIPVEGIPDL